MSFESLGLSPELLRAVREQGYTQPTPIQAQAIPAVLSGGDLMAGAQTGTGKTAGFTLPMLQRLLKSKPVRDARGKPAIRALVLTPTRELAAQVEESVRTYGQYTTITSMVMFGGVGMQPQIDKLRRGVDILVATPGRLLDHQQQGTLDLSHVEVLVLDEADRMLDMGFIHDIKKVLALLPQKKQSLLFSATFSDEIKALADRLLNQPALIEVARRNATADTISQRVLPVGRERKKDLLAHLIREGDWHQVLVFTRMKHGANRLAEYLNEVGITAMAIHGNKSQGARTKALADFKSGDLQVLVATDIAARGIDIDQLPHVVNFELPNVPEDYVHRIGRTGRAGAEGEAVSLVCLDEEIFLKDIERLIRRSIPRQDMPGFGPAAGERAEPIVLGRMTIGVGGTRHNSGRGHGPGRGPGRPHDAGRSDRSRGAPSGGGGNGRSGGGAGRSAAGGRAPERASDRGSDRGSDRTGDRMPDRRPGAARPAATPGAPAALVGRYGSIKR
jgi:ATP-dependent RNA helicase RhlE